MSWGSTFQSIFKSKDIYAVSLVLYKQQISFTCLKYSDAGQVKHFKVSCHKNMMFAIINGHNFFYTIAEMIQV